MADLNLLPYLRQIFHEGRCHPKQRDELIALGLIAKFPHNSSRDSKPLWLLTKKGGALLRRLDRSYAEAEVETMTMREFEERYKVKPREKG